MPDLFGLHQYGGVRRSAGLSDCGAYRYWLRRSWNSGGDGRTVTFVMLNPSSADHEVDDPTIRRCMGFAKAWGFSTLSVRNLFALRATDPAELLNAQDPIGPLGDIEIQVATSADVLVVAWGAKVPFGRDRRALVLFGAKELFCLGVTKGGYPRHPLYVRADQPLIPYPPSERTQ